MAQKILITGDRNYKNIWIIYDVLSKLDRDSIIIHGNARGADILASTVAKSLGFKEVIAVDAEWGPQNPADLYARIVNMRGNDISGMLFGDLVVNRKSEKKDHKGSYLWELTCSVCGEKNFRTATDLKRGRTSCLMECREQISINSPIKTLYGTYSRNALRLNREFLIDFEWFKKEIKKNCHYCGSEPTAFFKRPGCRKGIFYNGLDRVDSSIGYIEENLVTCCKFCNWAKGRWGVDDFEDWLTRVRTGYGRGAGPIRNRQMLDEQPDLVIAFHDDIENSKGTKDCKEEAEKRGIETKLISKIK